MGSSSYVQTDFRGGFWSQSAQGRMEDPEYKRGLNECYNAYPISAGAFVRRPSFRAIGYTRGAKPAKLLSLASETKNSFNMEVSSGHLRFVHGAIFVTDGTQQLITNVTADPAAVWTTGSAHGWVTGDTVILDVPDPTVRIAFAVALNRVWHIEVLSTTTFILHDVLTDRAFNGANVAWASVFVVNVSRITDVSTPYLGESWRAVKRIQTDKSVLLLHPAQWMYELKYTEASPNTFVNVSIAKATLIDGPYNDPQKGSTTTPTGTSGVITLAFSYEAYDATKAYSAGDYVTYSTYHWRSVFNTNVNHTPADGSAYWVRTSALDFLPKKAFADTDVGRHIRLLSEPPDWAVGTTYADGDKVTFRLTANSPPSYWMCIAAGTIGAGSKQPGGGTSNWVPYAQGTRWTWGKITAISSGTPITGTTIGNMTEGGGLAAVVDGSTDTADTACGRHTGTSAYVGLHAGAPTAVTGGRLFPARNPNLAGGTGGAVGGLGAGLSGGSGNTSGNVVFGLLTGTVVTPNPTSGGTVGGTAGGYTYALGQAATVTVNLRAGNAPPASDGTGGTILGTSGTIPYSAITGAPIQVPSNDATTTFTYVWYQIVIQPVTNTTGVLNNTLFGWLAKLFPGLFGGKSATTAVVASEAQFYSAGLGGSGISVEILGDPLLYSSLIHTWRLGAFNDTDPVYPTCGCYHQGRVWLAFGKNRFAASEPIGDDGVISFAPTEADGTVTDGNGIAYTFNSDVNAEARWMLPGDAGIVLGLGGGERLLFSTNQDQALTPTNINVELKTSYGSSDIDPVQTPLTSLFVHANGRDVHEYMRDAYSGRFVAPPLTANAHSLTETGIVQLAYQRGITSLAWAVTADGRLIGTTYERSYLPFRSESPPEYNGWHHHEHGANRKFISCGVGPSLSGSPIEALAVITQDNETGDCRIEVATDLMPDENDIYQCNYLDGMMVPTAGGAFSAQSDLVDGGGVIPTPPDPPPPTDPYGCGAANVIAPGFYRSGTDGTTVDRTNPFVYNNPYIAGTPASAVLYSAGSVIAAGKYFAIGWTGDVGDILGVIDIQGNTIPNSINGRVCVMIIQLAYGGTSVKAQIVETWDPCLGSFPNYLALTPKPRWPNAP